jgi:hypothetical protein
VKSEAGNVLYVSGKKVARLIDFYGFEIVVLFHCARSKYKVITERRAVLYHSSCQLNK